MRPALLLGCFAASGAAALIYEVVWERYLRLLFGNTIGAVTATLAVLMGGLALGSWLFGRLADRVRSRTGLYCWLEMGCALHAVLFPQLFALISMAHNHAVDGVEEPGGTLVLLRLALASALLLPPTILMGGTFPVIARILGPGRISLLYGVNSAGAVLGCLAAGFWLLERLGMAASLSVAALTSAIAGAGALLLGDRGLSVEPALEPAQAEAPHHPPVRGLLVGVFLSGMATMIFELGWTRLLALVLGSTVHAFATMLAGFIAGLALGACSLTLSSPRDPIAGFARGQCAIGLLGLACLPIANLLPDWSVRLRLASSGSFALFQAAQLAFCIAAVLPITFLLGRTFPLAIRSAAGAATTSGADIGRVFGINTAGTVLGTVLAGLWLIPGVGVRSTLATGSVFCLFAAMLAALDLPQRRLVWGPMVALSAAILLVLSPEWNLSRLTGSSFRVRSLEQLAQLGQTKLLYFSEDEVCAVSVDQTDEGVRTLRVNGKPDASTTEGDMRTQLLLAHYPLVLHPSAKEVLVIGMGSGTTAAAALTHPIRRLDCVELSRGVIGAKEFFSEYNRSFWRDPRARLLLNDASSYLQGTSRRYDCIISEPSNPWVAGISSLYTAEFFRLCRSRMSPGGVMAQWLHTYEMGEESLKTLVRTFRSVFPHAVLMRTYQSDIELIGSEWPLAEDLAASGRRLLEPAVAADLTRLGLDDLAALQAERLFSEQALAEYTGPGLLHEDNFPREEFQASRSFFEGRRTNLPSRR